MKTENLHESIIAGKYPAIIQLYQLDIIGRRFPPDKEIQIDLGNGIITVISVNSKDHTSRFESFNIDSDLWKKMKPFCTVDTLLNYDCKDEYIGGEDYGLMRQVLSFREFNDDVAFTIALFKDLVDKAIDSVVVRTVSLI